MKEIFVIVREETVTYGHGDFRKELVLIDDEYSNSYPAFTTKEEADLFIIAKNNNGLKTQKLVISDNHYGK